MSIEPNSPSTANELSDLLLRWRQHRDQGEACSPEALCPDRPELREELRKKIKAIELMEQVLDPGLKDTLVVGTPHVAPMPRSVPGYELLSELGRGGMGVVYKARQVGLNRLVALKMILAGAHAGPQQRERFQAEAQALARLRHPNIVQVFETGESEGLPYLSLEYVEGGSLDQRLSAGPLSPREAAALVETLARAVQAAHETGIVHRDLKPANILLASGGREPPAGGVFATGGSRPALAELAPKVTDFGLAKMLDMEGQTRSGDVIGTPCYMAPEQAEGRARDVGPATDVYALGAILYECLAGTPPFRGESAIDVLLQVRSVEPTPPTRHNARLPRDLETICLKCLEKEPSRRYRSAGELAEDLRRFLDDVPVTARRVSMVERGVKWARRRPERAALAAFAFLLLPLLVFILTRSSQGEPQPDPHLNAKARAILVKYCFTCHGHNLKQIEGDLTILDHAQLIGPEKSYVVPGDVKQSFLLQRIEDGSMPPDDKEEYPRLSSDEIGILKDWILAGAPAFEGPKPEDHHEEAPSPLAVEVHSLLKHQCQECHSTGKAKQGIKIRNHDLLVEKRKLVVPGKPDQSPLYRSLIHPDPKKRMPPSDAEFTPTDEEIAQVRRWIEAGAPPFPLPKD